MFIYFFYRFNVILLTPHYKIFLNFHVVSKYSAQHCTISLPILLFNRVRWGLGTVGSSETEMENHIKNKKFLEDVYVQEFKLFLLHFTVHTANVKCE